MFYLTMHSTHFSYSYMERNVLFNNALNTFYLCLYRDRERNVLFNGHTQHILSTVIWREMFILTTHSTHFIYGYMERERNVLFNDTLNTFYLWLYGVRHMIKDHSERERE